MKKICFVIGMGRSGTSMLSGMLSELGVNFGDKTHGPNEFNKKGYFEDAELTDLNDRLVQILSQMPPKMDWMKKLTFHPPIHWLNPRPFLPYENWNQYMSNQFKAIIKHKLNQKTKRFQFFGLKDPRVTLLLPLYMDICQELGIIPYVISIKRDPESVAKSLWKFHNFQIPREHALELCKRYNSDVEKFTKEMKIVHTEYENIIKNPLAVGKELAEYLNLPFTEEVQRRVFDFVDIKLKNN